MGSGGVGGYFGARLAKGGADVTFIARGAHLAAMREHGLVVESAHEPLVLPKVNATDDPSTIAPVDLVLFAVKLWDTEAAAASLKPIMRPDSAIISLQNGVQKDDALRAVFGEAAVMGGVAYMATTVARPGVIGQTGAMQRMIFGEFDGRRSPRAEAFLAACQAGGINARDQRRYPPRHLGEIRVPGRPFGLDHEHAEDTRADPRQSEEPPAPARPDA